MRAACTQKPEQTPASYPQDGEEMVQDLGLQLETRLVERICRGGWVRKGQCEARFVAIVLSLTGGFTANILIRAVTALVSLRSESTPLHPPISVPVMTAKISRKSWR